MQHKAIAWLLSYSLLIGLLGCAGTKPISSSSVESTQSSTSELPSPAPSPELDAIALNNQGVAKIEAQDFRGAVSDFTAAIAKQPKLAEAYLGRGYASFSPEKYPAALQDLNKALQLKPDYAEAYEYSGDVQAKLKRSGEALENWRKAEALYTGVLDRAGSPAFSNRGGKPNARF